MARDQNSRNGILGIVFLCEILNGVTNMKIQNKKMNFGLIGYPVKHSMSPMLHSIFYDLFELNAQYQTISTAPEELAQRMEQIRQGKWQGCNVTVPYKLDVIKYLDRIDPMAGRIGAVNTIARQNGQLVGYNTDWIGIKKSCDYHNIPIKGRDCIVIGAGGAGYAVAFMCAYYQARSIHIMNRTIDKAERLAHNIKTYAKQQQQTTQVSYGDLTDYQPIVQASVCFQTTAVGMHPNIYATPISDDNFFNLFDFAVDIIYNPKETVFIKKVRLNNSYAINGLSMLYFQGVESFQIWTSVDIAAQTDKVQTGFGLFRDSVEQQLL